MDHDIRKSDIISAIWMGAFVGCFIILLIMVIDAYIEGPDTYLLPGRMIINSFYGTIIVGWAFTFSGLVYKTDIAFPVQVFFQISVGMSVMLIVAVKVHWMVVEWGIGPIITWIVIALIATLLFWIGFYLHHLLQVKELNDKLQEHFK